jgi:two-component system CheB/CheR fusion protein
MTGDPTRPAGNDRPSPGERAESPPAPAPTVDFPVVAIGASAGGLEATRKLIDGVPAGLGMAFILVQHLDPTHESMMVDLLSSHTAMTVGQAVDGIRIEPEHLYVIPPGAYLSVDGDTLRLSAPRERHGARLPFDFLLNAMAAAFGPRAICIVLSGTGADGAGGVAAIRAKGGLTIVQDPGEAGYDGMPRSAIATGAVDLILPVADMPEALARRGRGEGAPVVPAASPPDPARAAMAGIVALVRAESGRDFGLYKPGTLQRRVERRMALSSMPAEAKDRYLERLRNDPAELAALSSDLLIHVTRFFRDPEVFKHLETDVIPGLVSGRAPDQPLRIWIAGCSTGEETYSLTMIFREQIAAAGGGVKLQVFASDIDPEAIAFAREGLYRNGVAENVSPERQARFFTREEGGWRVSPELRAAVVFSVQDVLSDPPFSRLDLVSCRNLLIYLRPEAQARVLAMFQFALRDGGLLLLGASETVGAGEGRFGVVSKSARLYRHLERSRPADLGFATGASKLSRPASPSQAQAIAPPPSLGDLCRRLIIETHAPAAVLINRRRECLYSLGPTDRYLRVAPGAPSLDLLAMARSGLRTRLASAVQRAFDENRRVQASGGQLGRADGMRNFDIDVQPVLFAGELLMLVCFVETPQPTVVQAGDAGDVSGLAELEHELEATRVELQSALRSLEMSAEEQTAVNEEALSVNEEYQSTNEELLTSKEELQSLNEELTALNSQLQETLERQRTTTNDLQNILYSTDVATLFLDRDLNIRFFTPATKALFNIIPGDIGRPLSDLHALSADAELLGDAGEMLAGSLPIEREVETREGAWFLRRIQPYRAQDSAVEGVVITFTDITERKRAAVELEATKLEAEKATASKSRFLAAASHDLRQPLQTLALLHGLLARRLSGAEDKKLVVLFEQTVGAMSAMLNTVLDINQIDAGTVQPVVRRFPVGDMLDRLNDEFAYHAKAKNLELRTAPCSLWIDSDPNLLEQILRNLLSNAIKYTVRGKVLLGCRRRGEVLSLEVWDTGQGIAAADLGSVFEEYRQLDNPARERSRGVGLGLSIVQRLAKLLGHEVRVRSWPGRGSVFTVDVALVTDGAVLSRDPPSGAFSAAPEPIPASPTEPADPAAVRLGEILVVEDDPDVRELLEIVLKDEGRQTASAHDGPAALRLVAGRGVAPALVLADYNLPNGLNGLDLAAKLRARLGEGLPVVILTGDISNTTRLEVEQSGCTLIQKPVKIEALIRTLRPLLVAKTANAPAAPTVASEPATTVLLIDDDIRIREAMGLILQAEGWAVQIYPSCETFLESYRPGGRVCLLIDAYLPDMSGLELLERLRAGGDGVAAVMITGDADVRTAVAAMRAGASDFIEKPVGAAGLCASIRRALDQSQDLTKRVAAQTAAASQIAALTPRQREILDRVVAGQPSKNIAADLGISQRTVENHRAAIMHKTGSTSLPALARLAMAGASGRSDMPYPELRLTRGATAAG